MTDSVETAVVDPAVMAAGEYVNRLMATDAEVTRLFVSMFASQQAYYLARLTLSTRLKSVPLPDGVSMELVELALVDAAREHARVAFKPDDLLHQLATYVVPMVTGYAEEQRRRLATEDVTRRVETEKDRAESGIQLNYRHVANDAACDAMSKRESRLFFGSYLAVKLALKHVLQHLTGSGLYRGVVLATDEVALRELDSPSRLLVVPLSVWSEQCHSGATTKSLVDFLEFKLKSRLDFLVCSDVGKLSADGIMSLARTHKLLMRETRGRSFACLLGLPGTVEDVEQQPYSANVRAHVHRADDWLSVGYSSIQGLAQFGVVNGQESIRLVDV